jgi:septal ring factor EnvC (AmiA/AmiB activator)
MLKAKLPLIILAAIIVVCVALIGYSFNQLQSEKARSQSLEDQLGNLQKIQKDLKVKLEDSKKQAADLDTQLKDSKTQIDSLTSELDAEKKAKQDAMTEMDGVKAELEAQKAKKADLEGQLSAAQTEITKTQGALKDAQARKMDLEAKVKDLEAKVQKVELGTINVGGEGEQAGDTQVAAAQPAGAGLEGKVLVVNKEYNFAVINLGTKENVNINDVFGVYSQGKYIGDVKVEKVHEAMSAANFVSTGIKDKIAEGDKVVLKGR